jgi:outer membrane receptor protein involved in Fe transport
MLSYGGLGGQPFKPTKAEQYEVGVKYQPTFMPALFTFSAFDIVQQNTLLMALELVAAFASLDQASATSKTP